MPWDGAARKPDHLGVNDMDDLIASAIKRTLALAYRQQAGWTDDSAAQCEFHSLADQVEAVDGTEVCCPCCEEVLCDGDCPLAPVRGSA